MHSTRPNGAKAQTKPVRLSILIVTFNNQADISSCLNAVAREKRRLRIVLVDNASKDKTKEFVQAFQNRHPGILFQTVWNAANFGYAHAMNQAFRRTRSEFVLLLGPDTVIQNGTIATLIRFLKERADVAAVAPQLINFQGQIQPSCRRFPTVGDVWIELTGLPRLLHGRFHSKWKMPDFNHQTEMEVDQPEASCLMIRRNVLEHIGFMDERFPIFFNDVDLCRRIRLQKRKIVFTPHAKTMHRKGAGIYPNRIPMIWKSHQGFYRYFQKYRNAPVAKASNQAIGLLLILAAAWRSLLFLTWMKIQEMSGRR